MIRRPEHERFESFYERGDPADCWEWAGGQRKGGYGSFRANGQTVSAHRYAWARAAGEPVPEGLVVMHSCDNPPCVNPEHLSVGTVAQNNADSYARNPTRRAGPPRMPIDTPMVLALRRLGYSCEAVAGVVGCSRKTIERHLRSVYAGPRLGH